MKRFVGTRALFHCWTWIVACLYICPELEKGEEAKLFVSTRRKKDRNSFMHLDVTGFLSLLVIPYSTIFQLENRFFYS